MGKGEMYPDGIMLYKGRYLMNRIKIMWVIVGFFMFCTIVQFLFLKEKKEQTYKMPVFLPSSLVCNDGKIDEENVGKEPIDGITVDDLVRGLLFLKENEKLSLSKEQAGRIYPFLRKIADKKYQYLELRNLRHHLNEDLMDTGILLTRGLTQRQFDYIIRNRDEAVLLEEMPSYEDVVKSLNYLKGHE